MPRRTAAFWRPAGAGHAPSAFTARRALALVNERSRGVQPCYDPPMEMHTHQLSVPVETVRRLVDDQFPSWRRLPIRRLDSEGTVNALFRIGQHLVARFPLVAADAEVTRRQLESEALAARRLFGRTRFATPEPVAIGESGLGYPLPWSVQTWMPGKSATEADPGESAAFARDLAEFIRGVRAIDTEGRAFSGEGRGGDLGSHDAWVKTCLSQSGRFFDVTGLGSVWNGLRELPREASADVMSHTDLIPGNVLVTSGRLSGVIDVGGLQPADPALDLVAAWHLLETGPRQVFRDEIGCSDLEWERGKAWAFEQALGAVWYYEKTNLAMHRMGQRTLCRILAATAV